MHTVYNLLMSKKSQTAEIIINLVIVILTVIGIVLMVTGKSEEGALQSSGLENFNKRIQNK